MMTKNVASENNLSFVTFSLNTYTQNSNYHFNYFLLTELYWACLITWQNRVQLRTKLPLDWFLLVRIIIGKWFQWYTGHPKICDSYRWCPCGSCHYSGCSWRRFCRSLCGYLRIRLYNYPHFIRILPPGSFFLLFLDYDRFSRLVLFCFLFLFLTNDFL